MEDVGREVAPLAAPSPARVPIEQPNPLYRILRWLSGWAIRWILGDVAYAGATTVPSRGAVLLVINHPNALCDILLTFGTTPRPIHFVGAIAHAASPLVGGALRAIGAIFVTRAHERKAQGDNADAANREAMTQMIAVLQQGGVVAIFPEGGVRRDDPIGRLQPGAAALALRAAREGGVTDLTIVPVGIGYRAPDEIRTVARVTIGESIDVDRWDRATHGDAPRTPVPRRTEVAALLSVLADRLSTAARTSRQAASAAVPTPTSVLRLVVTLPVALWGGMLHLLPFVGVRVLGRATMTDPVERLGRLAVPGVFVVLGWYVVLLLAAGWIVWRGVLPLWCVALLVLTLPRAAWAALRWADAWRARSESA